MLHVREIKPTRAALRDFVRFPLALYRNDPNHALTPVERQVSGLIGRHNALLSNGVQRFIMVYDDEKPVGRVLAGIDFRAIQVLGKRQGYISLFECIDSQEAAGMLFAAVKAFFKLNGISIIVGPNSAMFDAFGVGLLVEGFDLPPAFLCPYNPPYYPKLFQNAGFTKYRDAYAYGIPLDGIRDSRYESVLQRAGKRFGYTVENVNLQSDLKRRSREFARVIAESTPPEWEALPPTSDTIYRELKRFRHALWPDYALMAYAQERPVGLLLIVPDFNQILRGRMSSFPPVRAFKTLFARSTVKGLRTVMLYVVPEYQKKGVETVMIHRALEAARRNGCTYCEAAMIDEQNMKMLMGIKALGGTVNKVYRQYQLSIQ